MPVPIEDRPRHGKFCEFMDPELFVIESMVLEAEDGDELPDGIIGRVTMNIVQQSNVPAISIHDP